MVHVCSQAGSVSCFQVNLQNCEERILALSGLSVWLSILEQLGLVRGL